MSRKAPYYQEIAAALERPGCPLCRLLAQAMDKYIDAVLWEMATDPKLRGEVNQARGYCQFHGWLLVRSGGALSTAIILQGVLRTLMQTLETASVGNPSAWESLTRAIDRGRPASAATRLLADLAPQRPCPACALSAELEQQMADALLAHLEELAPAYRQSAGLCLAHLRLALARGRPGAQLETLLAAQLEVWRGLDAELSEFIRKNDHRFRGEGFGAEHDSWQRALAIISGPKPAAAEGRGLTQSRRDSALSD